MTYSTRYCLRYSLKYLLRHLPNLRTAVSQPFQGVLAGLDFVWEGGLVVHNPIYYISPMLLAGGLKLEPGCMTAYASLHDSSNQFA